MSNKITNIIEELKTLTLVEANDLVKEIEKTFDVDTSTLFPPMMMNVVPQLTTTEESPKKQVEEKTSFDLTLTEVPADKKIPILKIVRSVTGLGLKESKEIVDNVPKLLKEGLSKEESENLKKELEAAGAKISIQ